MATKPPTSSSPIFFRPTLSAMVTPTYLTWGCVRISQADMKYGIQRSMLEVPDSMGGCLTYLTDNWMSFFACFCRILLAASFWNSRTILGFASGLPPLPPKNKRAGGFLIHGGLTIRNLKKSPTNSANLSQSPPFTNERVGKSPTNSAHLSNFPFTNKENH